MIVPAVNVSVVFGNAFINFVTQAAVVKRTVSLRGYKKWVSRCSEFSFGSRYPSRKSGKGILFDRF